jgi:hypothetical protein
MSRITGGRVNLGVARETTRGTCVNPTFWIPWVNFTFDDKVTSVDSAEALGVIEDSHEKFVVEKFADGDVEGEVRDDSFGLYLYALLGSLSTSAPLVAGTYDHTFTLAETNQHTTLTLSTEDPNGDKQYCKSAINTFELNAVLGEYIKYNIGFMARGSHDTSVDSDIGSSGVENKFRAQDVELKLATTRAGLAAASAISIQSVRLTVSKNVMKKQMLGTVQPDDFINQSFAVEGEFTLPYNDQTYRDLMLANTYNAVQITLKNSDVALTDGATYHPTITIVLPRCGFKDWTPNRPKGELFEQTIGFKGYYDFANSESSIYSIVLRNDTASY